MKIFVGNLSFAATEADVNRLFADFGSVASVKIVMEKKGKKSRGFGFTEMLDDEQAQAAIAALDGAEFMGRPLNVSPARPKPEVEHNKGEEKKMHLESKFGNQPYPPQEESKDTWYNPVFNKKRGRYKTGRRSRSYMKRQAEAGIVKEDVPKPKRENPMRWRKRSEQPRPWQKTSRGEVKPWQKTQGENFKPWQKNTEGASKPWKRAPGGAPKPWKKKEGGYKPWRKSSGDSKPWQKKEDGPKPWKKSSGGSKPWNKDKNKKRPRPHQSRIQSRRKPGGYIRGN